MFEYYLLMFVAAAVGTVLMGVGMLTKEQAKEMRTEFSEIAKSDVPESVKKMQYAEVTERYGISGEKKEGYIETGAVVANGDNSKANAGSGIAGDVSGLGGDSGKTPSINTGDSAYAPMSRTTIGGRPGETYSEGGFNSGEMNFGSVVKKGGYSEKESQELRDLKKEVGEHDNRLTNLGDKIKTAKVEYREGIGESKVAINNTTKAILGVIDHVERNELDIQALDNGLNSAKGEYREGIGKNEKRILTATDTMEKEFNRQESKNKTYESDIKKNRENILKETVTREAEDSNLFAGLNVAIGEYREGIGKNSEGIGKNEKRILTATDTMEKEFNRQESKNKTYESDIKKNRENILKETVTREAEDNHLFSGLNAAIGEYREGIGILRGDVTHLENEHQQLKDDYTQDKKDIASAVNNNTAVLTGALDILESQESKINQTHNLVGHAKRQMGHAINRAEKRGQEHAQMLVDATGTAIEGNYMDQQQINSNVANFMNQVNDPNFESGKKINSALTYIEQIKSDDSVLVGKSGKQKIANAVISEINKIADLYGLEALNSKKVSSEEFKTQLSYLEQALIEKKENFSGNPLQSSNNDSSAEPLMRVRLVNQDIKTGDGMNNRSDSQFMSEYKETGLNKPELDLINKFNNLATNENSMLTPDEVYGVLSDNNISLKVQPGKQKVVHSSGIEDISKTNQEFDIPNYQTLSSVVDDLETLTKKKSEN